MSICIGLFLQFANYRLVDQLRWESKSIRLDQFLWNICTTFPNTWKKSPEKRELEFYYFYESAYSFTSADILLMLPCPIALKRSCRRSNYLKLSFDFSKWNLAF